MARPTTYNIKMCKEICVKVSSGKNIIDILKEEKKYPSLRTWFRWKDDNDELWHMYVKAIQNKTEYLNSEIDRIMKKCEDGKISPSVANVLIQTLKWKMSKFYPKMFGDKVDITSDNEKIEGTKIDLSNLTDEQLKRLGKNLKE